MEKQLAYLENMSAVGCPHPEFGPCADWVQKVGGVNDRLLEERIVACYTFEKVLEMHSARGCEVLVIDAEGSDCAILRSVMSCCRGSQRCPWPWIIRFETRGFAPADEGRRGRSGWEEEEDVIRELQQEGYLLVEQGRDATLLHGPTVWSSNAFAAWADQHFFLTCCGCKSWLLPSNWSFAKEAGEGRSQWLQQGLASRRRHCQSGWCCRGCRIGELGG